MVLLLDLGVVLTQGIVGIMAVADIHQVRITDLYSV